MMRGPHSFDPGRRADSTACLRELPASPGHCHWSRCHTASDTWRVTHAPKYSLHPSISDWLISPSRCLVSTWSHRSSVLTIGFLAVVAGLGFVGMEIQQNTVASRAAEGNDIYDASREIELAVAAEAANQATVR
jgi:hypothetical protein